MCQVVVAEKIKLVWIQCNINKERILRKLNIKFIIQILIGKQGLFTVQFSHVHTSTETMSNPNPNNAEN